MFLGPRAPKGCQGKARSSVNIDVSKHWSNIVKNLRFNTIFTSLQAPKDDKYITFGPFEAQKVCKKHPFRVSA